MVFFFDLVINFINVCEGIKYFEMFCVFSNVSEEFLVCGYCYIFV